MGKAIQDFNFFYWALRPLVAYGACCHYHRVVIKGKENLLPDQGYILAPNHQQGLMEPMAVLMIAKKAPVFLARADIFKQPAVAAALTFLKILPVFRIRDGKESLSKNAEIFEKSKQVILDNHPLCLMAEGRHNNRHQLLPLVKGMFRIAGDTQKSLGDKPLYIIPCGVDFDDYERPYHNLTVEIGKPIPVQQFMDTYRENEPLALNQMRDTLAPQMMHLMHDIRSKEYYEEAQTLCLTMNGAVRKEEGLCNNSWNRFQTRKTIAHRFDAMEAEGGEQFNQLIENTREYMRECQQAGVRPEVEATRWNPALLLLSTLLVIAFLIGCVVWQPMRWAVLFCIACYPIPFLPTHLLINKMVADTQFHSSFNFGVRFFLSIFYVIAFSIVMGCTAGGFWGRQLTGIDGFWWWLVAFDLPFIIAYINGPIHTWLRRICENWHLLFKSGSLKKARKTRELLQSLIKK